jgi:TatD DNase family protein
LFDTHIHLDLYESGQRERLLEAAWGSGIEGVVSVSMGMDSCLVNRELALRHSGRIMPAYGHHPEQQPLDREGLQVLCDWIRERGAEQESFAIGEVGLPYYMRKEAEGRGDAFDISPYMKQLEGFIRLAAELDRPIALHAIYEDAEAVIDLLERYSIRKAHFHWFKGSSNTVTRIVRNGYYISVTPDVLYEPEIRELAAVFPLNRLMVETDGPWPFEGAFAGKQTVPGMVSDVIREISLIRGLDTGDIADAVNDNSRNFYGWNFDQIDCDI